MGFVDEPTLRSSTNNEETSNIDKVIDEIGCGISQYFMVAIIASTNFVFAYQTLIMYFLGDNPPWTCINKNSSSFCQTHYGEIISESDEGFNKRCSLNRSEWKYTTSKTYSTVTEFDLACGKEYLNALANSAIFFGWGGGGIFTGILTDKYGRKVPLIMATFCVEAAAIGSSFATSMWQLIVIRTFIGVCTGTIISAAFVYLSEFSSSKYRSLNMNIVQVISTPVVILLSASAMYLPEWRKLELYAALPGVLVFFAILLLPESPRWLHAVGKSQSADRILHQAVKRNKSNTKEFTLVPAIQSISNERQQYSYIDLFKNCSLIPFVLSLAFGWLTCGLVFYGLSLESSDLGGSIYVNLMLSNVGDIVGCLLSIYLLGKGRRRVTLSSLFLCGILMALLAVVHKSWTYGSIVRIILAMIGKVCINLSFCGFYVWTAELYPTVVRMQGLTICQVGSRIGSAIAPFLSSLLQSIYPPLPFIIMACFSIVASLAGLILPETKGKPSREKFEDLFGTSVSNFEDDNDNEPLIM